MNYIEQEKCNLISFKIVEKLQQIVKNQLNTKIKKYSWILASLNSELFDVKFFTYKSLMIFSVKKYAFNIYLIK